MQIERLAEKAMDLKKDKEGENFWKNMILRGQEGDYVQLKWESHGRRWIIISDESKTEKD